MPLLAVLFQKLQARAHAERLDSTIQKALDAGGRVSERSQWYCGHMWAGSDWRALYPVL